ncbi:MAG: hypothetical protein Q7R52_00870 [archaeon]|nr:hypothetical protein [archaeon]
MEKEVKEAETKPIDASNNSEKMKMNPWVISTIVLGIIVIGLLIYNFSGGITGKTISKDDAGTQLLNFYTQNGVTGLTLKDVKEANGLYLVTFNYQGQEVPIYITKDGKLAGSLNTVKSTETTPEEIPKTDKPTVDLYVMSFCPYGNRAENTMVPAYNLLKNKINFNVHYIVNVNDKTVSSLHGQPEVNQNEREACVLSESGLDAWWKFTVYVNNNCGSDGNCWQEAAQNAGLESAKISQCLEQKGLQLMTADQKASNAAGATGSPTLVINGVQSSAVYQYGNVDSYKQAICSAFNTAPTECATVLQPIADSGATGSC